MVQRAGNAAGMGKAKKDGGKVVSGSTWSTVKQRIKMLQGDNAGEKVRSMQEVIDSGSSRGRLAQGRRGVPSKLSKPGIGHDKNGVPGVEEDESGQQSDESRGRGRKRKASSRKQGTAGKGQDPVESEAAEDTDTDEAEDEDAEKLYEVQAIRRKRVRQGNVEFLVKWQGWPEKDNTWEPYDHVGHLLDHYESKQGARKRGGVKRKTYKPRKAKHSSTNYRNSTAMATQTASISETGVTSMGLKAHTATSPRRTGGSNKKPTVTPLKVGTSEDTDEDVRTPQIRITEHDISEPLDGSCHPRSLSDPEEDVGHIPMDTENSGGGSDILNGDANRNSTCTTTGSEQVAKMNSGMDVVKYLDTQGSAKLDPRASETCQGDRPREDNSQILHEEAPVNKVAVADVLKAQPAPGDSCSREGEVLDGESPVASTDLPLAGKGTPDLLESPETKECIVTEEHATEGDERIVGAKRRKDGCVKRVRLSSDTVDDKSLLPEGSQCEVARLVGGPVSRVAGTPAVQSLGSAGIVRSGQEDGAMSNRHLQNASCTDNPAAPASADSMGDRPPYVVEIIKAISYNQTVINGKQDVVVIFRARSSDGQEVFVNNKEMREKYPMLLIDFYEQHLRYSNTQ